MNRAPSKVLTSGQEQHSNFWNWCVMSSVFFCVLCYIFPPITKFIAPRFHASLSAKERRDLPAYLSCLVHHAVVVPFAVTHIYDDLLREDYTTYNYAETDSWVVAYTFGYMIGDIMFFALGEALHGEFDFLFHHLLSIALVVSVAILPGPTARFVPHVMLCELSQLFFVAAWFLRLFKSRNATLILVLEAIFAVTFVMTRIINFPVASSKIIEFSGPYVNLMLSLLLPMNVLQFYWLTKIIRGILALFEPASSDEKAK